MEVDPDMKYGSEDFAVQLARRIPEFNFNRDDTILDNVDNPMSAPHPSPAELAQFAEAAYVELSGNESDSSYENNLKLPSGWKLLTTARNKNKLNGYFGAAYWSPQLQQVVLAHRGTVLSNMGAIRTNLMGVVFKNYSSQISSAATFAEKVRCTINDANKQPGKHFQLSITGHSLGGWLAQLTGLSVKHLKVTGGKFIESLTTDRRDGIHAHVVVFDSPGCKDMLEEIVDSFWARHGNKASLASLDISSYLSAPNRINTFGLHEGNIYRVMIDVSKFSSLERHTIKYTIATHKMQNFINAFAEKKTIHEMKDWPVSKIRQISYLFECLPGCAITEFMKFHRKVSHAKEYHLDPTEYDEGSMETRYKEKGCDKSGSLRILSEDELKLLNFWSIFKGERIQTSKIQSFLTAHNLGECKNLFLDFYIDMYDRTITCDSKETLEKVIERTKLLMRWFSAELLAAVDEQSNEIPKIMYSIINQKCLNSLPERFLELSDSIALRDFLVSTDLRLMRIETEDCHLEMLRLFSIVCQFRNQSPQLDRYIKDGYQTFLYWNDIDILEKSVVIANLSDENFTNDNLLIINCASMDIPTDLGRKAMFERLFKNNDKKLILVSENKTCDSDSLLDVPVSIGQSKIESTFKSNQLTRDSRKELFEKRILNIGENVLSITDVVGKTNFNYFSTEIDNLINITHLKEILRNEKYVIKMENWFLNSTDYCVNISTISREASVESAARTVTAGGLLVISGNCLQEAREKLAATNSDAESRAVWVSEKGNAGEEKFKETLSENPNKKVYWLEAKNSDIFGIVKQIYDKKFYMSRRIHQFMIKLKDFKAWSELKDTFIFQGVPETMRKTYQENENILIADSDEDVNNILQKNCGNSVHFLKFEEKGERFLWKSSLGSIKSLRPYIRRDHAIDEEELSKSMQKVVIIADEPGMGKSTSLASVARLLRSNPANWVIWINMKHFRIPSEDMPTIPRKRCEFLLRENLSGDSFPFELLQFCLNHKHSRQVHFVFDGFDEIRQRRSSKIIAKDQVLELLKYLHNETTARLWVTTRLDSKELLENGLSTFAMMFEKIDERKQREYLLNFWRSHLLLESGSSRGEKLRKCANNLYNEARKNLGGDMQSYMGVPLQMRMLAEVFLKQVDDYVKSETNSENTFQVGNVCSLFTKFIRKKYEIYCERLDSEMSTELFDTNFAVFVETHGILSLRTLFPEFAKEYCERSSAELGEAELCRIGLVQSGGDGCIEFIHRTLIEYFFAEQIVRFLRKTVRWYGLAPLVELLLKDILLQDSYKTIRMFMNDFLLLNPISDTALEYSGPQIGKLWEGKEYLLFNRHRQTALHLAVEENHEGIVDFLIGGLKSGQAQKSIIGFIAAHNSAGRTALGLATETSKKIMENMLRSIEHCPYEIQLELVLATCLKHGPPRDALRIYAETSCKQILRPVYVDAMTFIYSSFERYILNAKQHKINEMEKIYGQMENDIARQYLLFVSTGDGNTVLHIVAKDNVNQIELIKKLCNRSVHGIDRSYNSVGSTPLHDAARAGHLNIVQYFVNRGLHVDCQTLSGETAVHIAAVNEDFEMLKFLTENGADIDSVDMHGRTALHKAAERSCWSVVEFLVEKGADINFKNSIGHTALVMAAGEGDLPMVEYLFEKGADINSADPSGRTALHISARKGHFSVVEFLVDKGADINAADCQGSTALHSATLNGHLQLVKLLVEMGMDINLADDSDYTALQNAAQCGHLPVVKFLVDKGCDVNFADSLGKTALDKAVKYGHVGVVEFFIEGLDVATAGDYRTAALRNSAKDFTRERWIQVWSPDI